jgi:hypothetical protein
MARKTATQRRSSGSNSRREVGQIIAALQACLKFAMKSAGMNAADVAAECGISEATVSRWRTDHKPLDVSVVMRSRRLWPWFLIHLYHRETAGGHLV